MSDLTIGNLIFVQDWGSKPLSEYTRTPSPGSPVQTLIGNTNAVNVPGGTFSPDNLYPGFVSQFQNGDLCLMNDSIHNDIIRLNSITLDMEVYIAEADMATNIPSGNDILAMRIDANNNLIIVYYRLW